MKLLGKKNKWLIGGTIIAVTIIGLAFLSVGDYSVYFYTPKEAVEKVASLQGKDIKIGGMVKGGSMEWKPDMVSLKFVLSDLSATDITVSHHGTPPDMFKENSGVVVEGRLDTQGKNFVAKKLYVKHSEEYKIPTDKTSIDHELLQKSMFKGE